MPNETKNAPYTLAHRARVASGAAKNESRIVVEGLDEPARAEETAKPKQSWPVKVNDENTYDRNTYTPDQMLQGGWNRGKPDAVKTT